MEEIKAIFKLEISDFLDNTNTIKWTERKHNSQRSKTKRLLIYYMVLNLIAIQKKCRLQQCIFQIRKHTHKHKNSLVSYVYQILLWIPLLRNYPTETRLASQDIFSKNIYCCSIIYRNKNWTKQWLSRKDWLHYGSDIVNVNATIKNNHLFLYHSN